MKAWKVELNDLLEKIERHTSASLWRIKKEFERSGSSFDRKFRKRFLRLTNNRLSEVYDRIEIESLATEGHRSNQGQVHYRNDSERPGIRLRGTREPSEELEKNFKQKMVRNETKKLSTHSKKSKHITAQRPVDISRRLGKKHHKSDIDELPNGIFPIENIKKEATGSSSNPFRSRRTSESTVSQPPDGNDSFSHVKIKVENPSPTSSQSTHDGCTLKRKHDTNSEGNSDNNEGDTKKRKINKDDNNLGKEEETSSLEDMEFYCVHCSDSNDANESNSGTIEDVYGHWLSGHTDLKNVKPFWFYVTGTLACFYCNFVCNYQEMVKHHQDNHTDEPFAVVTQADPEHDGLFQSTLFNPARLSVGILGKLFAIDIHKKRQCGRCDIILETQHEMEVHQTAEHNGETISSEYFDGQSAYVICDHCSCKVDGTKFFHHIESHRYNFPCSKCDFKTKNLIDLVVHEKDEHRTNSLNYHCFEFSERLKKQFFNSKVVFGNGLVLTNYNFKNTIYDDSEQFDTFIASLIEKMKRKFNRIMEKRQVKEPDSRATSRAASVISNTSDRVDQVRSLSVDSHRNPFRVSSMPSLMTELEQQNQLDNNLSVLGFPRLRNEDLTEMFLKLCKQLKVNVSHRDIVRIYRTNGVIEQVIVKFRNFETKVMVKNSAHTRDVWTNDLFKLPPNEKPTKIFINLHTTRFYGKMVSIAREARKNNNIYSYYLCKRGLIVKRTENSKERVILSNNELMDFIYGEKKSKSSAQKRSHQTSRQTN
ncbi:uncharacterized protein LOC129568480 isoform X2 [Sitodiplosis mosellana]|uniref:uncharacterized protein LOC129568480 isoform X2 n=1 Tax=Sitodiplosis mosellana TaxID=263140 RepID=UPI002444F164|nr:uncharacterized protein LOC129568480 isoform X2 [Sitodiplosis mosellana]